MFGSKFYINIYKSTVSTYKMTVRVWLVYEALGNQKVGEQII